MNDTYTECLVKKGNNNLMTVVAVALAIGAVAAAGSMLSTGLLGFMIFLVMSGLCYLTLQMRSVEYEYLLAGGQFSVDKILNKSKRKKMAEYSLEDIQAIFPEKSLKIKEFERQIKGAQDFSSGKSSNLRFVLIHQKSGVCNKILVEPDDKMLHCFKLMIPRKCLDF